MEIHKAEVTNVGEEYYLVLKMPGNLLKVPLTQDVPKEVQKVFNHLIVALKKGMFEFALDEIENGDINYHVAREYISQLNTELQDVYKEMENYAMLDKGD